MYAKCTLARAPSGGSFYFIFFQTLTSRRKASHGMFIAAIT